MPASLSPTKTAAALRTSARVCVELLLVLVTVSAALWLLGRMWSVVWPLIVGLFLTTLTWPLAGFLRRRGWPPALAASVVTVAFLLAATGIVALIAVPVSSQSGELAEGAVEGIQRVREWAAGPPLNIGDDQITSAFDTAVAQLQDGIGSMLTAVVTGVSTVVNGVVTAFLALFLMFFFLKDGPRFLPWLSRQLPGRLATDVPVVAARSWETLGAFVRSQAFVGLIDAVLIGVGLWILDVPLVLPLAVLTFVSAFVPIVGALFAGLVAVLIALVSNGLTDALIVLAIIVGVQQLEGNVFQPMIQSRGLGLHAAVVLLAVTLGGSLAGIVGSLLAVPAAALIAVVWNYLRDQLTDPPAATPPPAEPHPHAPTPPHAAATDEPLPTTATAP
ncbi:MULTISPECIES: AI-2E family transporter [Streptomyces]|uniref:AI-2 transport protein TqsA n=3 Tax=Streptomyces TaxID=1883 RepID=A0A1D8G8F3_9ACTN|nr:MULTISPECIES: AI-2E family transporter [Streptomyces]AOT61722.1 AI-2 transport protein TqsA [Streptomyces rubrolavendulae]KAF0650482.1 membrane protein [Streptomyces fradiae ATCC 10745 = DSM 40063]QEV14656.1 AI-2E family transporter [Streptomyces fradiae ATCC 10745 = DSM 40063]UQS29473.1 AI-2E family transporter [Streptomyces fradiae]